MKITRRAALKSSALAATALALRGSRLFSQASAAVDAHIDILPAEPIGTISPEIYSHFIEHLGGVIYDGVWVGPNSKIPNTNGIRQAFIDTMRAVQAPLLRWPGGCFADSYDWRDGLGAAANRPARTGFWGQQDPNRYGLHEFMHTCRAIGCKPYLAANMRSLPARDFYQEIEYCNAPAGHRSLQLRRARQPERPRRPARGQRRSRSLQCRPVGRRQRELGMRRQPRPRGVRRRCSAASPPGLPTTATHPAALRRRRPQRRRRRLDAPPLQVRSTPTPSGVNLFGLSVHYYTSGSPTEFAEGDALNFNSDDYYDLLTRASIMERIVTDHWAAMGTQTAAARPAPASSWSSTSGAPGTARAPRSAPSTTSRSNPPCAMPCSPASPSTSSSATPTRSPSPPSPSPSTASTPSCWRRGTSSPSRPPSTSSRCTCRIAARRPSAPSSPRPPSATRSANAPIQVGGNSYTGSLQPVKTPRRPQRLRIHLAHQPQAPHAHRRQPAHRPAPSPPKSRSRSRIATYDAATSSLNPTSTPTTTSPTPTPSIRRPSLGNAQRRPPHPHLPPRQRHHAATHPRLTLPSSDAPHLNPERCVRIPLNAQD